MNQTGSAKRKESREYLRFYLIYTAVFAIAALFVFGIFLKENKSFIWRSDGLKQHYTALAYYGGYLREILTNLFMKHEFTIPMWEMSMGYGADILLTLHYYVLGDPLNLLSVFFSIETIEYLYSALIIVRIYLAGVAFSAYGLSHKKSKSGILIGAMIYCFCGYVLYAGVRHPYFVNPMIYLPFLLIGIDRIFQKKKPYLFIVFTAISAVSNFYFFYMLCIFMFLYAIFRYWMTEKCFRVNKIFTWLLKFIGFFVIGLLLAAPVFLLIVLSMLGSQRLGAEHYIPLLYDLTYYAKAFMGFAGYVTPSNWSVMAYTPVALAAVLVLFVKKKEHMELKIGFLFLSLLVCLPFAGHVFNGFSYVTVRWIWGYSMLVSYITACAVPYLFKPGRKEKIVLSLGMVLWMAVSMFIAVKKENYQLTMAAMCILSVILILWCILGKKKPRVFQGGILAIALCSLFVNAMGCYHPSGEGYVEEFVDRNDGINQLLKTPSNAIETEEGEFTRYDQYNTNEMNNITLLSKKYGTQFYFSMSDSNISAFMREMYLNFSSDYHFDSLDGRSILEALASVRYFVVKDGEESYLPYGYAGNKAGQTVVGNASYSAYENREALPFGIVYDSYIKRAEYDEMNVLEKQEALLYGVVLEESEFEKSNPEFSHQKLPYELTLSDEIEKKDNNRFYVKKKGETMTLTFQGMENCETYLILKDLHYEGKKDMLDIKVQGEAASKKINYRTEKFRGYCGIHNFLCNLGYQEEGQTIIRIQFPEKGTYSFEDMYVACQPVETISNRVSELGLETMEQVVLDTNSIKGQVSLEKPGILLLSIPYSKGFTAYVDGEECIIKQADTMYMALELEQGEHQIELKYETPYLKAGFLLMIMGVLCVVGLIVFYRKQAQSKERKGKDGR